MHCVQEIRHRGFLAAVMTYFQNVGLQHLHIVFGKNLALRSFFRIAGQEKTWFGKADSKDQRVVILGGWCNLVSDNLRPKEGQLRPVPVQMPPADFMDDARSQARLDYRGDGVALVKLRKDRVCRARRVIEPQPAL